MNDTSPRALDPAIMQQELADLRWRLAQANVTLNLAPMTYQQSPPVFPRFLVTLTILALVGIIAWQYFKKDLPKLPENFQMPTIGKVSKDYQQAMEMYEMEKRILDRDLPARAPVEPVISSLPTP